MGIRDKPISAGSPWQNCFAERLIGSIRRECVDHLVVFGERQLRRILSSYALYYNEMRTHRSLQKDAPVSHPIQPIGASYLMRWSAGCTNNTFESELSGAAVQADSNNQSRWRFPKARSAFVGDRISV
jgi:Integrase core domain